MEEIESETPFNPSRRRLCPDGACVGLIGPDGRCKVCGLPAGGPDIAPRDEAPEPAAIAVVAAPAVTPPETSSAPAGGFDPRRRLCDDGSCVGVVGPDGVCRECGRRAGS